MGRAEKILKVNYMPTMKNIFSKKTLFFIVAIVVLSYIFLSSLNQKDTVDSKGQLVGSELTNSEGVENRLDLSKEPFSVLLADTPELQERGLSGRESLLPNQVMLFIFDEPSQYGIWMKDMKFPLDILWLDQSKRIIFIQESVSPETYPEVFAPDLPAKYVLEAKSGFVAENKLKIGSEIYFSENN